jgi:hypothetical protein
VDILKRDLKQTAALILMVTTITFWPTFLKHFQVRTFKKFMTIQTSKADPPRLAFDEINLEDRSRKNDWDLLKIKSGGQLVVGEVAAQFVTRTPTQALRTRKVILPTMAFTHIEVEKVRQDREWIQELPPVAQTRLMEAQIRHGTLDEDWQPPTLHQQIETKLTEIKQTISETPEPSAAKIFVRAERADGTIASSIEKADVVASNPQSFALNGLIELRGGLPPPTDPRWQIQVSRYEDDTKLEDARVDIKKSSFAIQVPEMNGTLKAKLTDTTTGETLGEGTLRLAEYNATAQRKITIEKTYHELAMNTGNFYANPTSLRSGTGRQRPIPSKVLFASLDIEGKTDQTGSYHFEQIQKGSWGLVRTEAKGFYGGLHLVQSGKDKYQPLFPENMIQALRQIVETQSLASENPVTGSIVWGQVLQSGKPLAGSQVQVEGFGSFKPVYFNSLLLPDPDLKATGDNGYFAFVDLPEGFHTVTANFGTTNISHVNIVVDEQTVSIAELESKLGTEKAGVKVFDAFNGQPQAALLDLQSLPEALEVNGFADINLPDISRLSLVKVSPRDTAYSESLQLYEDNMDSIHLPLISTAWLQGLFAAQKSNLLPDTGVVVGFVPVTDFAVYLGHDSQFPAENIIYFDPQGQIVPQGVAGGGFVLVNVPKGVQSIVVANAKAEMIQTQVIPMDDSALVTLKFR